MTLENMEITAVYLLILAAFLAALLVFGLVFELVIVKLPPVQRYLDRLPGFDDDEEVYQEYLDEREAKRRDRRVRRSERKRV